MSEGVNQLRGMGQSLKPDKASSSVEVARPLPAYVLLGQGTLQGTLLREQGSLPCHNAAQALTGLGGKGPLKVIEPNPTAVSRVTCN